MFHTVITEMEIDLEETWIDLFQDSQDYYLKDHNPDIDPPIPPLNEEWQSQQQPVDVPVVETVPEEQNFQPGYFDVEFAPQQCMEEGLDDHHHLTRIPIQKTMLQCLLLQGKFTTLTATFI